MNDGVAAPQQAGTAVTEQQIAEALDSLFCDSSIFISFNGVVQLLEAKLGVDLSTKLDFIRARVEYFLRFLSQPVCYMPKHHQHEHFSLHQTPNFHSTPVQRQVHSYSGVQSTNSYLLRPPTPQPKLPQSPPPPPVTVAKKPAKTPACKPAKASNPTVKRKRVGPGGLSKPCGVSPELQAIVGHSTLPRTEIVRQLWAYIRKNNLQDPSNKRKIICNDELRLVFETDSTDMFKMNKLLTKHILPLEPSGLTAEDAKKLKSAVSELDAKSDDPVLIVRTSEALAAFLGCEEREISQAEVLRQMWEYIKTNQLEDPSNPTAISCDAKLKDLLGCASISALEIPEMVSKRHFL